MTDNTTQDRVPVSILTGFLGSGKTTLLSKLMQAENMDKVAVIINEFGDLGVDGEVLGGCGDGTCSEEDVLELTNGCICCTVADDFIPTLETLLERDEKPDHIVIETSGLALPKPLIKAFQWPEVRSCDNGLRPISVKVPASVLKFSAMLQE